MSKFKRKACAMYTWCMMMMWFMHKKRWYDFLHQKVEIAKKNFSTLIFYSTENSRWDARTAIAALVSDRTTSGTLRWSRSCSASVLRQPASITAWRGTNDEDGANGVDEDFWNLPHTDPQLQGFWSCPLHDTAPLETLVLTLACGAQVAHHFWL